jgi:hypothetical protein
MMTMEIDSMDKYFLRDYEAKEKEEIESFLKTVSEGKFSKSDRFPQERRFKNLQQPVTYKGDTGVSLWPVVAFSGTVVVPLLPADPQTFEKLHGFRTKEIDHMVSFAEETGKLQFVLLRPPTDYTRLDFLDPIFTRMKPPQFMGIPVTAFASRSVLDKYYLEFSAVADAGFRKYVHQTSFYGSHKEVFDSLMTNLQGNYMMIRALARPEISDDFAKIFRTDYDIGSKIIEMLNILVLRPLRNPLRSVEAYSMNEIGCAQKFAANSATKAEGKVFPFELGKLLLRKLTHYPESLEACKQLSGLYKDHDVTKLFNAVNEGIIKNDPNILMKNESELSAALDNVWDDKSIQRRSDVIKFGVPLALGAMGTIVAGLPGAYVGLLSGLGFDALDRVFEFKEEAFTENISKKFASSYQTIIFDFQKNNPLTKK